MNFEPKRFIFLGLKRTALSAVKVSSLLGLTIGIANAQAQFPTGCNNGQFFTTLANTTSGTPAGSSGGIAVASAEASTAQALEIVAQRRIQDLQACPIGSVREAGICKPKREAPRRIVSTRSDTKPSSAAQTHLTPNVAELPPAVNAIWSEAYADYEKRTGLTASNANGSANETRTQRSAGVLFGADHTIPAGDGSLTFGFLGGWNETRQNFTTNSQQQLDTLFFANVRDNFGATNQFQYLLPAEHDLTADVTQTLKGGSIGTTFSASRGGFFSDGVFKIDFYGIEQNSSGSDTHPTQLNAFFQNLRGNQLGCISPFTNPGPPPVRSQFPLPGYQLSGNQTFLSPVTAQATTAANFILAQDFGYHIPFALGYWVEPLAGARYTYSAYGAGGAALGLQDGYDIRVQAGARFGRTTSASNGYLLIASFTALAYSDVLVHGFVTNADGFSAGFLLADQGKLRGQGIATLKLDLLNGFSFFAECQGRGGQDYWGAGGRIGGRYQF